MNGMVRLQSLARRVIGRRRIGDSRAVTLLRRRGSFGGWRLL